MDSITHALYKAIVADDQHQRRNDNAGIGALSTAGLQPLSKRQGVHEAYAGAAETDLHITLERGPELLALNMEFIAAGYAPPGGFSQCGGDVIIGEGRIDLHVPTDDGKGSWVATLQASSRPSGRSGSVDFTPRKAGWTEQTV
jgi:hypothetical protein